MKNIYFATAIFIILFTLQSCDERLAEINRNPNAVTELDPEYLFSNAILQTFGSAYVRAQFPFGLQYAHYIVGQNVARFVDIYQDNYKHKEYKEVFNDFYYGPIRTLREVIRLTEVGGDYENEVRYSMIKVIEVYNFVRLSDAFGAIPYIQGGLGQEDILRPEFDQVEDIYKHGISVLEDAIMIIESADSENGFPGADPLYENDLEQWVRFANSLRLRLAMRMRFADKDNAEAKIVECLGKPLIEDITSNAKHQYNAGDITEFHNPINNPVISYFNSRASEMMVETLRSLNDPRLELFVNTNELGEYVGVKNGLSDAKLGEQNFTLASKPSDLLVGRGAASSILTASEVWFLRAEAALFNIISGDANDLYQMGIRTSLEQWEVADTTIDKYLTEPHTTLAGTQEEMFEQIGLQLWIGLTPDGFEGWTNIRRTGYPQIAQRTEPDHELGATNGILPKRMKYPTNEININRDNYNKAIELQGPDEILTPLWWDIRD